MVLEHRRTPVWFCPRHSGIAVHAEDNSILEIKATMEDCDTILPHQYDGPFCGYSKDELPTAVPTVRDKEMPCVSSLLGRFLYTNRANPTTLIKKKQKQLVESNDRLHVVGYLVKVCSVLENRILSCRCRC